VAEKVLNYLKNRIILLDIMVEKFRSHLLANHPYLHRLDELTSALPPPREQHPCKLSKAVANVIH
jgi:hypothetical protein